MLNSHEIDKKHTELCFIVNEKLQNNLCTMIIYFFTNASNTSELQMNK